MAGVISSKVAPPLSAEAQRDHAKLLTEQRLHGETDAHFLIRFDLSKAANPLVRLDFAFDRSALLTRLDQGLTTIEQSILIFGVAGAMSILLALGITVIAMRTTRKLEGHFQEIYQRASMTEMAAQLVHDLRNPLTALRSNVKALVVSPQHTKEIVDELDQDIVNLDYKLSAFLNLTRRRDDVFEPVDVGELIQDAVRLAKPVLAQQGLSVDTDVPVDLPQP